MIANRPSLMRAPLTLALSPQAGRGDQRGRAYDYEELINRDKASLDIFWLKDESLADSDNLPAPDILAQEIVEDLEAALEQFREILADIAPETGEISET